MRAVIVNPASGSGRTAARWRRIVAALGEGGAAGSLEVQLTTGPGDAITITRRLVGEGVRDFVVLGGDGTVGEVVAGCLSPDGEAMLRTDITLAIVHQGTGGDLVRGLDIPRQQAQAVAVARSGALRRIDVGVARFTLLDDPLRRSVRAFASTANVGLAADVVSKVAGSFKKLGNNGAFAAATAAGLGRNRARRVRLSTAEGSGTQLDIVDIDVCNNRYMGGGMLVAPDAMIDDGAFDVVVIQAAGRLRLLRTFPKIYSGRHVHDPLVTVHRTPSVSIEVPNDAQRQGVVLDGELVGCTPATFEVIPAALSIRVPRASSQA